MKQAEPLCETTVRLNTKNTKEQEYWEKLRLSEMIPRIGIYLIDIMNDVIVSQMSQLKTRQNLHGDKTCAVGCTTQQTCSHKM